MEHHILMLVGCAVSRVSGEIARADVADACVNALLSKDAENVTFEVYETKRRVRVSAPFLCIHTLYLCI